MARQIISNLNEEYRPTARQRAFEQGVSMMGQGFGKLQQQEQTKRQQAFNEAQKLASLGLEVSPEEVYQERFEGEAPESGSYLTKLSELTRQREDDAATREYNKQARLQQAQAQKLEGQKLADQKHFEQQKELLGMRGQQQEDLAQMRMKQDEQKRLAQVEPKIGKELGAKGYQIPESSPVIPSKKEAEGFRSAIADSRAFTNNIKSAEKYIKDNKGVPSSLFSPNDYRNFRQSLTNAKLDLKGDAFFKLGVLAGPDMQLIDDTFGEIDSLMGTWQPNNMEVALEKLKGVKDYVNNKLQSKAYSLGYEPVKHGNQSQLRSNEINVPFNPVQNPQIMSDAVAGQNALMSVDPAKAQRLEELRAKARGR